MTRFFFNGIDNRSSYNSNGYSNYTSIKSNPCLPGQTYSFTVDGYSIWNCTGYVIWVDWNQDGSFNNSDEPSLAKIDKVYTSKMFTVTSSKIIMLQELTLKVGFLSETVLLSRVTV